MLREIQFQWDRLADTPPTVRAAYPYHLPPYQGLESIEITGPVTFFVGENGTGKSTLLEGIAKLCNFPSSGGETGGDEHSGEQSFPLADVLRLSWMPKINRGFFLRAETFYNFASLLDQRVDDPDFNGDPYARYGGRPMHVQSHGESFLSLFQNRFHEKGLYLLDEPEAALSVLRQLAFLRLIKQMTETRNAQFLICTHSPILLGFPGAQIYSFDTSPLSPIRYEDTEHYSVTRAFITRRKDVLRDLFAAD